MNDELDIPQIRLNVENVNINSVDIGVSSEDGGKVILLLLKKEGVVPGVDALRTCNEQDALVASFPDVFEARILQLARGSSNQTLMFEYLRPDTPYKVLAYIDSTTVSEPEVKESNKGKSSKKAAAAPAPGPTKHYGYMTGGRSLSYDSIYFYSFVLDRR